MGNNIFVLKYWKFATGWWFTKSPGSYELNHKIALRIIIISNLIV